jgi:hypothetical protein
MRRMQSIQAANPMKLEVHTQVFEFRYHRRKEG